MLFNEAKLEILSAIEMFGELTSVGVGLLTNRTPENSSMLLLRYQRQGLLRRRKLKGKTQGYSLTERGTEKLTWLKSDA